MRAAKRQNLTYIKKRPERAIHVVVGSLQYIHINIIYGKTEYCIFVRWALAPLNTVVKVRFVRWAVAMYAMVGIVHGPQRGTRRR